MIWHHFKISIQRIINNMVFSAINVFGLAIGVASFLILFIYVANEQSFDKHFTDYKNIYRVISVPVKSDTPWARSLGLINKASSSISEIQETTQFTYCPVGTININEQDLQQKDIMSVDGNFVNMFNVESVIGDLSEIAEPNTAFISEDVAKKYFKNENPIGKTINIKQLQYVSSLGMFEIRGIVKNTNPRTHFNYQILLSQKGALHERYETVLNRKIHWVYNYVKIEEGSSPTLIAEKILEYYESSSLKQVPGPLDYHFSLMPLEDIHLKSTCLFEMKESSSKININLFIIISFVILLVSLLNFINLTIAKLINRSKEIGLNKLVGANNRQLLWQVLIEVLLLCSFSIAISLFSIELVKPIINNFFEINFNIYYSDPVVYISIVLVLVICGGLSALFVGFFFMGKSSTIQILQSKNNYSGSFILKSLLVLQIAVVIILLSNTFLVNKQINFILSKSLGFNKENVVVLNIKDFTKDPKVFANELKKQSYVHSVGFAQQHFGYPTQSLPLESFGIEGSAELVFINYDYLKTMDIKLIQNQIDYETDTIEGWVFNNHLYKRLLEEHNDREGIESYLASQESESGNTRMRILGVTEDFNYNSAHQEIGDYAFLLGESPQRARFMHVRLKPGDLKTAINKTQEVWNDHYPGQEFNYFFIDDKIAQQYKAEQILGRILSAFSIIGFLISIISISALSLFISQQRTKEIGIRKVNGSQTMEIIRLLNKDFIKWVTIAFIIASPIAYIAMNKWLQNFAYKTTISWWIFALAAGVALSIVLLTVSWQTFKAARKNPVEALRYE